VCPLDTFLAEQQPNEIEKAFGCDEQIVMTRLFSYIIIYLH
jgi:hypothetical protein